MSGRKISKGPSLLVAVVMFVFLPLVIGCGGEREVGGECDVHADCNERCVKGSDFPGGMCTVACDDYRDCPGGTSCISTRDGICIPECDGDRDCFGGYECESKSRHGEGGSDRVCFGD